MFFKLVFVLRIDWELESRNAQERSEKSPKIESEKKLLGDEESGTQSEEMVGEQKTPGWELLKQEEEEKSKNAL
jgi:hypothetical protein